MKPSLLSDKLRQQIAQEAARIVVDEGERDYFAAKSRAAKRFAVNNQDYLPTNQEI